MMNNLDAVNLHKYLNDIENDTDYSQENKIVNYDGVEINYHFTLLNEVVIDSIEICGIKQPSLKEKVQEYLNE